MRYVRTGKVKRFAGRIERPAGKKVRIVDVKGGTLSFFLAIFRESFTHPFETSVIRTRRP